MNQCLRFIILQYMDQLIQSLGNCLNIYIKQKGNLNSNTQQQQQVDTDDITIGYENKRQINDSQHFEMKIKRHNIFIVTMYHIYNDTIVLGELSNPYLVITLKMFTCTFSYCVILQVLIVLIATFILKLQSMDGNIGLQLVAKRLRQENMNILLQSTNQL
eukprot:461523_1